MYASGRFLTGIYGSVKITPLQVYPFSLAIILEGVPNQGGVSVE